METGAPESSAREVPFRPRPEREREHEPASQASIQGAIEQVTDIIESLRDAVDEMEEVLETVELAERQKTADEQEIESLRRALRQLQRPREGGQGGRDRERERERDPHPPGPGH
jgi:predicted RNase H-like nuclease (RuvC/YqgF family)